MTNTDKLIKRILDSGIKYKSLARDMGLSYYGLKRKIYGQNEFKATEITKLCDLLRITSISEKEAIFFDVKVDCKSTSKTA